MKAIARSLAVILMVLIAVPALAVSYTIATAVQLLATTALIMGGTQHPLSLPTDSNAFVTAYMGQAVDNYITPGTGAAPQNSVAVIYPAEFFPVFGSTTFDDSVADGRANLGRCLGATAGDCTYNTGVGSAEPDPGDDKFTAFGYSQSAVVVALVKNDLINNPDTPAALDGTEIIVASNPLRPNGGILGRGFEGLTIPVIGITFYGPTQNSCPTADPCSPTPAINDPNIYPTIDVAQQYDLLGGDAPARLSPLAFANSLAAYALLHGNVPNRSIAPGADNNEVIFQDEYGDTEYWMITAPRLPLLLFFEQAGVPGPVLALPDALLRVWIEDKYRRDLSPGEHVQFQLSPIGNPIALVGNMLGAIPVGIDDTVAQATGNPENRPLGTENVYRPFGVGGPVYDPDTGLPAEDNVGIPTGAGDYDTQNSLQTTAAPPDDEAKLVEDGDVDQVGNDETQDGDTTPEVTRPRPLQVLRESMNFDPSKRPSATRPGGDGPLKRIVNALTGQRPPVAEDGPKDEAKPAA